MYTTKSGKHVYGGGGITPDIFVPFDTSRYGQALGRIFSTETLNDFVYLNYVENIRLFKNFKSPQDFVRDYKVDETTWKKFQAYAAKDSVTLTQLPTKDRTVLEIRIKALMARQIWRNEGLYRVLNENDEMVKKGLGALTNIPKS
jgi:carboxyl-terminal processing protease